MAPHLRPVSQFFLEPRRARTGAARRLAAIDPMRAMSA
jgi:hypothetical protein